MNHQRPPPIGAPRLLRVLGLPYDERTIYELGTSPPLLAGAFGFPSTGELNEKIDTMLPSLTAWLRDVDFIDRDQWHAMVDTVTLVRLARDRDVDEVIFSNSRPQRGALQGVTDGYLPEVLVLWHIVDMLGYRGGDVRPLDLMEVLHTWCFMRLYEILLLWTGSKGSSRRHFPFYLAVNPPRYDSSWIHPDLVEATTRLDEISSPDSEEVELANDVDEYIQEQRRPSGSSSTYSPLSNASLDRFSRSMPYPGEFSPNSRRDSPRSPVTNSLLMPPTGSTSPDMSMQSPSSTVTNNSSSRSDSDGPDSYGSAPSSRTPPEERSEYDPEDPSQPIAPRQRLRLWTRASWEIPIPARVSSPSELDEDIHEDNLQCPAPGRASSPFEPDESIAEDDLEASELTRLPSPSIPLEASSLEQDASTSAIPIRGSPARIYRHRSPFLSRQELSDVRSESRSASAARRSRSRSPER
ncbi:hypothetical protein BJY00DRAFT_306856 [Aspergillus carlsbadensis]|nr:hypothetical protein BJY00DRAFT_306856 [Aspergillus carlsbadensis]